MEKLNRGVVAVRVTATTVYVGWRMFGTDPASIAFNVYRAGVRANATPITASTNYTDTTTANSTYTVRPIIGGVEQADSESATVWAQQYLTIPLSPPPMETMPDGVTCTYTANDCSVGDLDGDGEYEIVMKWDPTNSKDNSQSGYTGDVFLDAYKLNGTRLWRIDLGRNIRAGAHYTQFMVYDLDSDGKAEVACKTAPGTMDSSGAYLSKGPAATDDDSADYRNTSGYILSGPEYLTVFNGQTGREMATVNYNPPRGTVGNWGDTYGNRVDRFLACIAYLDGVHPSLVMCRGYYTRTTLAAWDWNGTSLTQRWFFDSDTAGAPYAAHVNGLGNHNLSVGDVNGDGYDEIIYGPMAIDHNGKAMYDTLLGHGDAMHLGKLVPDRPGLQVWDIHETYPQTNGGGELHDAATGEILWGVPNTADTGRGMAADVDPNYRGYEMWSPMTGGVDNDAGTNISTVTPSINFRIYWDGDLQDELLDGTKLDKWNGNGTTRLFTFYNYGNAQEINGTKANPNLQADILGDWREEVLYRSSDNTKLMIFTTTTPTNYRFYTLMHDFEYRDSIAWQNVAYNQPPHVDFYLGDGPSAQPVEDIIYPGGTTTPTFTPQALSPTFTLTRTNTPVPPTATITASPSFTVTRTATVTYTRTVTATYTSSGVPTSTSSAFPSFTVSPSRTVTTTPTLATTATRTNTAVSTASATASMSPTATWTNTPVNTATRSATATATSSVQPTGTGSATPQNTFSYTATRTSTAISTQTNTAVNTPTNTAVNTATRTNTPANTPTNTSSALPSPTVSQSRTVTSTNTPLPTLTNTRTGTPTGTGTVTSTESPDYSATDSPTGTPPTATVSPSITSTESLVPSETNTPVDTSTDTPLPTETASPSSTVTITSTASPVSSSTSTYTPTPSATDNRTPSATASVSQSITNTKTPTTSFTQTPSRVPSPVSSVTSTATATQTSTIPETRTPTPGLTATLDSGNLTLDDLLIYPNPYNPQNGDLGIELTMAGTADRVRVRIYSAAFRKIIDTEFSGTFTDGRVIDIPARMFSNLANGMYYVLISAETAQGQMVKAKLKTVIILK